MAELADQMPVQVLLRRPQDSPERSWEALTGHPTASLTLVSRLFVHPGAAGQGAARALLGTAVRTARQRRLVPALDVHAQSQRAIPPV